MYCKCRLGISGLSCKWCLKMTCMACRLPERHDCENLSVMKKHAKDILHATLESCKTQNTRNYEAL